MAEERGAFLYSGKVLGIIAAIIVVIAIIAQAAVGSFTPPHAAAPAKPGANTIVVGTVVASSFDIALHNLAEPVLSKLKDIGYVLTVKHYSDAYDALKDLGQLKIDAALVPLDAAYAVYKGLEGAPLKDKNVRLLVPVYKQVVYVVARPGSGVNSLKALEGKKVAVPPRGTASYDTVARVLSLAGVDLGKITLVHAGIDEGLTKLLDGEVDAAVYPSGWPDPLILGAVARADLSLVGLTREEMNTLNQNMRNTLGDRIYYVQRLTSKDIPTLPENAAVRVVWTWSVLVTSALISAEKANALATASMDALVEHSHLLPGLSAIETLEELKNLILALPLPPHQAIRG